MRFIRIAWRAAAITAASIALAFATAGLASAKVGPPVYSPEQAGHSVTGGQFRYVQQSFTLPNASKFANELDSFGISVHLRSTNFIAILGISTLTSCDPQAPCPWNGAVAVFDPTTKALVHSNPNSPAMNAGDQVTESIFYNQRTGRLQFRLDDATTGDTFSDSFVVGPSESFTQARVGAEFACDPFDNLACAAPFRYDSPAAVTQLVAIGNVRVTSYSGHKGGLTGQWWTDHKVIVTRNGLPTGAVDVKPSGVNATHNGFRVNLQP